MINNIMTWISNKLVAIALVIGLVVVGVLIYYTKLPQALEASDTIQVSAIIVLIIVTAHYATSTRKIAEIALNAELNEVYPMIDLVAAIADTDRIVIYYRNIGAGPALNLRVWIEGDGEQFSYLQSDTEKNREYLSAVGVNQEGQRRWSVGNNRALPTRTTGFDIVAEYTDVFRQGFQSKLVIINSIDPPKFYFGKKEN